MKDSSHHLKHIQKKVMKSLKKQPKSAPEEYLSEYNFENKSNEAIKRKMARRHQIKTPTQKQG